MKRVIPIMVILLLVATLCYAQSAREPSYNLAGKTNLTNISVRGLNVDGNPGYIELYSQYTDTVRPATAANNTYYLWVSEGGGLCMASYTTIATYASFPEGSWNGADMHGACMFVGSQSTQDQKGTGR